MSNDPTRKTGSAKMRPRARLISLIGEELISDESVAVVELVKNAYDADATKVEVRFEGDEPQKPESLIVADDGVGMTLETVLSAWFEPGTVTKRKNSKSPGGRVYQGAKGVGRFAAARLAEALYMETKCRRADDGVTVLLEWGKFDEDSYLDEVELEYEVSPLPEMKHGTTLTLIGLRKKREWDEEDFKTLHNRLSRLISPFGEVKDFSIELTIPGFPELTGEVNAHELIQEPFYRLDGDLNSEGMFTGAIKINGITVREFQDHAVGKKGKTVGCGGFSVEFRAWDRDRLGLSPLMLKHNLGLMEIRGILTQYSGVSIYRDGFRVQPYGAPGNDWLGLDNRSRQSPTTRLANNQVVAAIRISRESNPQLMDRTTREGLVHNPAYAELRDWVISLLALLEGERYKARPREERRSDEVHTLFEAFDLSPVVQEANRQLGKEHPVAQLVRRSDTNIREGVVRLQEHYSRLLMTAGIGQLVDLVIHEIGAPIGRVTREVAHLERLIRKQLGEHQFKEVEESLTSINGWLEQISGLRGRLDPKTAGKRGRATTFSVQEEILGNLMLFENLLSKQKIKYQLHAPSDPLIVKMTRSALGQLLANLLDNSVYWLTRYHGDGKGGNIDITLEVLEHGFRIRFCDDGPGVEESSREQMFDPYFSTKENGMGLGLYIARQVIEHYGKVTYRDDCRLSGACFEASFENHVGL